MKPKEVLAQVGIAYVQRFQAYTDRETALRSAMAAARDQAAVRTIVDMMTENQATLSQLWRDVGLEYDIDTTGQGVEYNRVLGAVVRK